MDLKTKCNSCHQDCWVSPEDLNNDLFDRWIICAECNYKDMLFGCETQSLNLAETTINRKMDINI
jgi:hypothetical protein